MKFSGFVLALNRSPDASSPPFAPTKPTTSNLSLSHQKTQQFSNTKKFLTLPPILSNTMVSPLTDRLLSGYSSSGNSSGESGRQSGDAPKPTTTTANDSSGYSADQEQSAQNPSPPYFIDLLARHRKRGASDDAHSHDGVGSHDDKKRRIERQSETNYIAHMARHEISRAGLPYPKINPKKSKILPSSVDFSKVTLIHSKDFARTSRKPVSAAPSPWNVTLTMSPDMCVSALQSLIKSCSAHYNGVSNPPMSTVSPFAKKVSSSEMEEDTSDVASTTSSVTEDGVEDAPPPARTSTISMGQALSISKQPRVIVIAEAPYTLVHCNAAFLEMTGVSSSKVLGHPLVDALDEQTLDFGRDFGNLHNQSLHMRCSSSRVPSGNITCRARLSPIGVQLETVTHYSIELDRLTVDSREAWERSDAPVSMPPHLKVVA